MISEWSYEPNMVGDLEVLKDRVTRLEKMLGELSDDLTTAALMNERMVQYAESISQQNEKVVP